MKKYFLSLTCVLILATGFAFTAHAVSMRTKISEKAKAFTKKLEKLTPKLTKKKEAPISSSQQFADLAADFAVQFLELQEQPKPSKKAEKLFNEMKKTSKEIETVRSKFTPEERKNIVVFSKNYYTNLSPEELEQLFSALDYANYLVKQDDYTIDIATIPVVEKK